MTYPQELSRTDKRFVVEHMPRDVRDLLTKFHGRLFVGGGFVRATIAGNETPSDIDLFGSSDAILEAAAALLADGRPGSKTHKSKNAITVLTPDRMPVQFITRWQFAKADALVASFDFTVCQAAVWRGGSASNDEWRSLIGEGFYRDLAGRNLVYTAPVRDEEAGGSMLRVIKYVKRGYRIQVGSLGAVIARLTSKIDASGLSQTEDGRAAVIGGLLREVDPLHMIDGLDVADEHEPAEGAAA